MPYAAVTYDLYGGDRDPGPRHQRPVLEAMPDGSSFRASGDIKDEARQKKPAHDGSPVVYWERVEKGSTAHLRSSSARITEWTSPVGSNVDPAGLRPWSRS